MSGEVRDVAYTPGEISPRLRAMLDKSGCQTTRNSLGGFEDVAANTIAQLVDVLEHLDVENARLRDKVSR